MLYASDGIETDERLTAHYFRLSGIKATHKPNGFVVGRFIRAMAL
jgi:hypothetical protein